MNRTFLHNPSVGIPISMLFAFTASLRPCYAAPPQSPAAPQPNDGAASQPAAPSVPSPELSAERCLEVAHDLLAAEAFARSRAWFEAARDRSERSETKQAAKRGLSSLELLGRMAPRLSVSQWLQGGPPLSRAMQGKVVVLFFFEIIEPEIKHDVDAMNNLLLQHHGRDLEVIGFACVLGDAMYQQPSDVQKYLADQRITFRTGLDEGGVMTLHTYKGEGTPHYVVIDRSGRVRRLGQISPVEVDFTVRKLLAESPDDAAQKASRDGVQPPVMPQSREGRELIETRAPRLRGDVWMNPPDHHAPDLLGKPRLIRFLTDGCQYCRSTVPALNRIHQDYADRGLVVIGVYHPKPKPRDVAPEAFRREMRRLEVSFPCLLDADWDLLNKMWLRSDNGTDANRDYTSASFVLDQKGRIRYVHPGPAYFPSRDPAKSRQNADYEAVRAAVEKVLSESGVSP